MTRLTNELLSLGGLIACCAAAIQIDQLVQGRAERDVLNYAITLATVLIGLGLTVGGWWRRRRSRTMPPDDRALTAAVDRLFAHFPDDEASQEAVRVVARAVTERRYRRSKFEG